MISVISVVKKVSPSLYGDVSMSQTTTIAKRELAGLFFSPIAYIVLFISFVAMGIVFGALIFEPGKLTEVRRFFEISQLFMFFIIPPLTMGLFAEEYKSGRMEMLRTSPITEGQLLSGKFLAAYTFYCFLLATTLVYLILLMIYGRPDYGAVVSSYLGMLLLGAMFVSIGVFFSACTQSQTVALLASFLTLGAITFTDYVANVLPPKIKPVVQYFGSAPHTADFMKGIFDTSHAAYFLSGTFLFLFLTYLILESRRWR